MSRIPRLFDPRIDVAFKMIFSETDEGKIALISFLNCVLDLTGNQRIIDIEFLNTVGIVESSDEKQSIMDVKVRTTQGHYINIEMQIRKHDCYIERSIYYLSKMYGKQPLRGRPYTELNKCISVNIVDFVIFSDLNNLHNIFTYKELNTNRTLSDAMELHYIELPKLKEFDITRFLKTTSECELFKWAYFFKYANNPSNCDTIKNIKDSSEGIEMAYQSLIKISADEKRRAIYESREKFINDWNSSMYEAKQEGEKIGEMRGEIKGERRGEIKGIKKGETQTQIKFAKYLISKGSSENEIYEATGLDITEIQKLKQDCSF